MFFRKKTNIATNEIMNTTLSSLLVEGETLHVPFYAIYEEKGRNKGNGFSFIGMTETALLIALLNISVTHVEWTTRIPLEDIIRVDIEKSLFMKQIVIKVAFNKGNDIIIRASVHTFKSDFFNQEYNLLSFIEKLKVSYLTSGL